jgi:DNA (cytosine-5)-methyltransferase 1
MQQRQTRYRGPTSPHRNRLEGCRNMGVPNKKSDLIERDIIKSLAAKMKYGSVESFSGPGGMSLGLEMAGFEVLYAFDYNEKAVETFCHNFGNRGHIVDASNITGKEILKTINLKKGELPLFSGGPPCQGFSKQKRGAHLGDNRNKLVFDYIRLINEMQPRFFIFENVAIFGQKRGQKYIQEMQNILANYKMFPHFYNTADYGLAQTRERFMMVGCRDDQSVNFKIPRPTVKKWRTVGEVLAGLPEPPDDYKDHPYFPNHQKARVTNLNIKRFSYVPEGGGWQDIPYELRLPCHQKVNTGSGGWTDVYGRLESNSQCPTITGGFDSFTRGRYGHPRQDRPLTPREAARLQGFPDSFVFIGNRGDIRSQIGNAVPPLLAEAVGIEVLKCLLRSDGLLDKDETDDVVFTKQPALFIV